MTRRIMITGAQGFLGRYVVAHLLDSRADVSILGIGRSDRSVTGFTHKLNWCGGALTAPLTTRLSDASRNERYRYESVDLVDRSALKRVLTTFRPDVILNLAAALRDDPWQSLLESNIRSVVSLFEALADAALHDSAVVLASTGSVYGAPELSNLPVREDGPCLPVDLYAASKRAAEDVGRIVGFQNGVPVVTARIFNLVGPGLQDRHLCAWLAAQFAAIQLSQTPPVIQVGPLDSTRDFIDVRDAAKAVTILAQSGVPGRTYNVASGRETRVSEVFEQLRDLVGSTDRIKVDRLPGRKAEIPRLWADISQIRDIGFEPEITLQQSIEDMLAYYVNAVAKFS